MIITIDGPTASGKSTLAFKLANKLNFYYLYSGLIYRGLAYVLVNFAKFKIEELDSLSYEQILQYSNNLKYIYSNSTGAKIFFDDQDISQFLKNYVVDSYVAILSSNTNARKIVYSLQHLVAEKNDIVADGRDGGTTVFPNAQYKFFLTSRPEVRAIRWQKSQNELGKSFSESQALEIILTRDFQDRSRSNSPLKMAADSVLIDNSDFNLEQTLDHILSYIKI